MMPIKPTSSNLRPICSQSQSGQQRSVANSADNEMSAAGGQRSPALDSSSAGEREPLIGSKSPSKYKPSYTIGERYATEIPNESASVLSSRPGPIATQAKKFFNWVTFRNSPAEEMAKQKGIEYGRTIAEKEILRRMLNNDYSRAQIKLFTGRDRCREFAWHPTPDVTDVNPSELFILAKGKEQGKKEVTHEIARHMLSTGLTHEAVKQFTANLTDDKYSDSEHVEYATIDFGKMEYAKKALEDISLHKYE